MLVLTSYASTNFIDVEWERAEWQTYMECNCHIFSKYLLFQMKHLVFQSKYLLFQPKTLDFDQNTRYFESEILKY